MMGMPITIEVVDVWATQRIFDDSFSYFQTIDERFSFFKEQSEVSQLNRGEIVPDAYSVDLKNILELAEKTKQETDGYFDIVTPEGLCNPSGLVKGWAIRNVSQLIMDAGYKNFYVDAGSDVELHGKNGTGDLWTVGIRNPFSEDRTSIVKVVTGTDIGVATSGTYIRGRHIYNPKDGKSVSGEIVSLTVIGNSICDADRYATAAFAMGKYGIIFIEQLYGFEGYMIDRDGIATETTGFKKYTL